MLFRGPYGWGEFSPFADYSVQQDSHWLEAAIEAAFSPLNFPTDASIAVNAIIGDVEDCNMATQQAIDFYGCRTIKLKVGLDADSDLQRVHHVAEHLSNAFPEEPIGVRIDANGRWSLNQATDFLKEIANLPIEYVEQPCQSVAELTQLRRRVTVPIAVDESIRIDRLDSVKECADIAILKVSPLGGLAATTRMAERIGVPVRISGALETSVGLAPSLLAAHQLAPDAVAGLGTGMLFHTDLVAKSVVPVDGRIPVGRVEPDPALLENHASLPEISNQWRERVEAAFEFIAHPTRQLIDMEG